MTDERKHLEATLLLPILGDKVGLGLKKQKIGKGLLNGWGGVLEDEETPLACVVREVFEEGGIKVDPDTLTKAAVILFHNEHFDCRVHVYLAPWHYPPLKETDEMGGLTWYDRLVPPTHKMMKADQDWLPRVLKGNYIKGEVWYGPGQASVQKSIYYDVRPTDL